jgi:two-component sensor histidine kinase
MYEFLNTNNQKRKILKHFVLAEIISLIYGVVYRMYYNSWDMALVLFAFALVAIVAIIFNSKGNYNIAKHIFFISTNFLMYYTSLTIGLKSGIYLFYFPVVLAYSFLLNVRNKKELLFYFAFTLCLFGSVLMDIELLKFMHIPKFPSPKFQFETMALLSFLLVIYQTYLYITDRETTQKQLIQTINDLKISENKHLQDIKDKEVLLAEVYHRVKNNLSVVSSLINLQMNTIDHEYTKSALMDCKNRVNSMAMIHQKFYEGKNYSKIDFKAYIEALVSEIKFAYNLKNKKITVDSYIDDELNFDLNVAIPCGIILNELISNSFKHAFNNQDSGKIEVFIEREKNLFLMRIVDNGAGFEYKDKIESSNSLGLILIQSLSEQLDGTFQYFGSKGTDFRMLFRAGTTSK